MTSAELFFEVRVSGLELPRAQVVVIGEFSYPSPYNKLQPPLTSIRSGELKSCY